MRNKILLIKFVWPQRAIQCLLGKFKHPRTSEQSVENKNQASIKPNLVLWLPNEEKTCYLKILSSTGIGWRPSLWVKIDIHKKYNEISLINEGQF